MTEPRLAGALRRLYLAGGCVGALLGMALTIHNERPEPAGAGLLAGFFIGYILTGLAVWLASLVADWRLRRRPLRPEPGVPYDLSRDSAGVWRVRPDASELTKALRHITGREDRR